MVSTANVTTVEKEDREFIAKYTELAADKKVLVKGIIIGLQLKDKGEPKREIKD